MAFLFPQIYSSVFDSEISEVSAREPQSNNRVTDADFFTFVELSYPEVLHVKFTQAGIIFSLDDCLERT